MSDEIKKKKKNKKLDTSKVKNTETTDNSEETNTDKLDTQIIVPEKIDTLTQMKKDISKLERLTKNEVIAKRNAIAANKKLENILIAKKEIKDKYNL